MVVICLLLMILWSIVVVLAFGCCVIVLRVMLDHVVDAGLRRSSKQGSTSFSSTLLLLVGIFYCASMSVGVCLHMYCCCIDGGGATSLCL